MSKKPAAETDPDDLPDDTLGWRVAVLEMAPPVAAALTFIAGLVLLASAAQPALPDRLNALLQAWPLAAAELSHFLASIAGVLLLIVADGLRRRLDGAYWLTLGLLGAGALFSLLKALDYEEAIILTLIALLLIPARRAFYRRSQLTGALFSGPWLIGVALALALVTGLLLIAYQDVAYRDELWWTVLRDQDLSRSLRALAGAVVVGVLVLVRSALRPHRKGPSGDTAAADLARAEAILARAEGARGEANLIFTGDKRFVFSPSGQSFVMFRPRGNLWIGMGDPVGPAADRLDALLAFHAAADAACASPALYSASAALLPQLIELGYAVRKIGEVAHIDAAQFSLEGPARARLRQTWNRFKREGWRIEVVPPGGTVDWAALKSISDEWLAAHGGHEKSFSLGRFDPDYLTRFPIAIATKDGEPPAAFSSLWPSADKGEIGIDLMRHRPGTPSGLMDILFIGLIEWAKAEGYRIVDLGMTPLAGISRARYAPSMNKIGAAIYEHGEDLYGFKGLRSYKSKFAPDWQPVFIGAPGYVSLPIALAQAAILTSGGLKGLFAK